jgi:hypothetical protein
MGTEISGALGAAVQRAVVERGYFFVCDKIHKRCVAVWCQATRERL